MMYGLSFWVGKGHSFVHEGQLLKNGHFLTVKAAVKPQISEGLLESFCFNVWKLSH